MSGENIDIVVFIILTTALILLLGGFIVTILYLYQKKQIALQKSVEEIKLDYEKNLLKTQLEIQEETFQHISQEIHDNIGLSLTLAKLNLNTINLEKRDKSNFQINESVDLIGKAIKDLSDISKSLNSDIIINHGLIKALEMEIIKLVRIGIYKVHFEVYGHAVFLNFQKELLLYRIVQEALNNIIKHAEAKEINLQLYYHKDHLDLSIQDDGIGFSEKHIKNKSGLLNMEKRAKMVNGDCTINSTQKIGTAILVKVPL